MSAAIARWLAVRSMTAAAISIINNDLRITVPHLLQGQLKSSHNLAPTWIKHSDIANKS